MAAHSQFDPILLDTCFPPAEKVEVYVDEDMDMVLNTWITDQRGGLVKTTAFISQEGQRQLYALLRQTQAPL